MRCDTLRPVALWSAGGVRALEPPPRDRLMRRGTLRLAALAAGLATLAALPARAQTPDSQTVDKALDAALSNVYDPAVDGAFDGTFALPWIVVDGCAMPDLAFRTTAPLPAHAEPRATSAVVRTVGAGQRIARSGWDRALTVTVRPALYRARRTLRFTAITTLGRVRTVDLSSMEAEIPAGVVVPKGEEVELLAFIEGFVGFGLIRVRGVVYLSEVVDLYGNPTGPVRDDATVQVQSLSGEIWVRLVPEPGEPTVWVQGQTQGGSGPVGLVPVCPGDAP